MYVKNFNGDEFKVMATTTSENEVNGNETLSGDIEYNKVNKLFIENIDRLWEVYDHNGKGYKITMLDRQGHGNLMRVSFTAISLFQDYMNSNSMMTKDNIHYEHNGSMTAKNTFDKIFADTPFTYELVDKFDAIDWENFGGGESRLKSFTRAIERINAEFEIVQQTVVIKSEVKRDTSIQYRHRLNASNILQSIDATDQFTHITGYGDFGGDDEGEADYADAKLIVRYESPLWEVIGEKRYSAPYTNQNIKHYQTMYDKLKYQIDQSLAVSVTADLVNLQKQGYPIDTARTGDYVFLTDERIGFDEEVRIVKQSITRNWKNEVLDASVTFGSDSLGNKHQGKINTAVDGITDIFNGVEQLPLSALDKRVQEISNIINGNVDSVFKYMPNGIVGWNGNDPNMMTRYVGDAIGFSKDGGTTYNTAMSAELGIVADYINTGTLRAITVDAVDVYGSDIHGSNIYGTYIEGSEIRGSEIYGGYMEGATIVSKNPDKAEDYVRLQGSSVTSYGNHLRDWVGSSEYDDVHIGFQNGQMRARNESQSWSLYFSDWGISTFSDGDGNSYPGGNASGIIEFHSYRYSGGAYRGLTLMSYGRTAIESSNPDGARIYLNPNGASVRVSDYDDNYYNIASSGFNQSSSETQKRNIVDLKDDAVELIKSLDIKEYKRLTKGESTMYDQWQAGIIVEEAPEQLIGDGDSIDLYSYINYIAKATQQLIERIEGIESNE